jgi:acyl phosphate:glycerol-3-phosphate acyltransferase
MTALAGVVLSYLLGAVPSSYIAGRSTRGIDLREHGSGNLGATNTFRVLGGRVAAPVMVFDVAKGFVPTWFFAGWLGVPPESRLLWSIAFGAAAVVGHVFPVYMRFRGGKGVATAAGVFLALAPLAVGLALVLWAVVLTISGIVSLASMLAAIALVTVLLVTPQPIAVRALGVAIAAFVLYSHRSNIGRIRRGEEQSFRTQGSKSQTPPSS